MAGCSGGGAIACMGSLFEVGTAVRIEGGVFHRGLSTGVVGAAPALAQWWACGGGGRTSPIWCCRPSAEAAGGLARRCVLSAVPPCTGPHRAGCDRRRSRPGCRSCTRRLGMRMRCGRCCWRTRSEGRWGSRGRSDRRWRGRCGQGCGRSVSRMVGAGRRSGHWGRGRGAGVGRGRMPPLGAGGPECPCCSFPCRPRGGLFGLGGMIRPGASRLRRRGSCGGRGCRRGWWPSCGSDGVWPTSRGSTPGSGWTTSPGR